MGPRFFAVMRNGPARLVRSSLLPAHAGHFAFALRRQQHHFPKARTDTRAALSRTRTAASHHRSAPDRAPFLRHFVDARRRIGLNDLRAHRPGEQRLQPGEGAIRLHWRSTALAAVQQVGNIMTRADSIARSPTSGDVMSKMPPHHSTRRLGCLMVRSRAQDIERLPGSVAA